MITNDFKELFKKTILNNKSLIWCSILFTIMAYGFTITNFSIGVDDFASNHYLHTNGWGNMIQQGRLAHVLFEQLFGIITFVPFLNDFIGAALFWISSLLFCGFFQYITNASLSNGSLIVFTGLYLTFSIVNEKFIYNLDVIVTMLSYVAIAYALLCSYEAIQNQNRTYFFWAVIAVMFGIASYESFIFVYICGIFTIPILKIIVDQENVTVSAMLLKGIRYVAVLVLAMTVYYALVFVVQFSTGQLGLFQRETLWYNGETIAANVMKMFQNLILGMTKFSYLPILEFSVFSVIGFGIMIYYAWKRKTASLLIWFFLMFLSNFGIHVIVGSVMYRAAQSFCLFIGLIGLFIILFLEQYQMTKKIGYLLAGFVVMLQLFDLNQWFYMDYSRYKKEEFAINSIATRLVSECDISKPIVFTNRPETGYLQVLDPNNQVNGLSLVYRGIATFGELQSPDMIQIFRMHGYDFLKEPTMEQVQDALKASTEMEAWPAQGAIQEFDQFIVVNFSEIEENK